MVFLLRARFSPKAKARSINWKLAPESIIQVAQWFSFTVHGNVIGSLDPKSCVEKIEAKTGVDAEAEERDTIEDDKIADDARGSKIADEMVAEGIRKATERQCLWREHRRADLDIGDKESGKRHSSDGNISKRLKTGSGAREKDKDDTLPDDEGGREVEDKKPEEEAGDEEEET